MKRRRTDSDGTILKMNSGVQRSLTCVDATLPFNPIALNGIVAGRFLAYFVAVGLMFAATVRLAEKIGLAAVVKEGCAVESFQLTALVLIAASCALLAHHTPTDRAIYALLTIAAVFAMERELNYFLVLRETWVCALKHSAQVLLIGGTIFAARHTMAIQFRSLAARPAFLLFLIGFAVVTLWAQVLGQGTVWKMIQPGSQIGKRYVEEHLELAGYVLILAGVIEEGLHYCRTRRRSQNRVSDDTSPVSTGKASNTPSRRNIRRLVG